MLETSYFLLELFFVSVAVSAVNWFAFCGFEWYFAFFSALCARCFVHFSWAVVSASVATETSSATPISASVSAKTSSAASISLTFSASSKSFQLFLLLLQPKELVLFFYVVVDFKNDYLFIKLC